MNSLNSVERHGISFAPPRDAAPREYWTLALDGVGEALRRVDPEDWEEIEKLVKLENLARQCLELDGWSTLPKPEPKPELDPADPWCFPKEMES